MSNDSAFEPPLTVKRKRMMIYFINATEKLIREDGLSNVSIRKVAHEAGYNSATIYNYFQDLDQLILFGSVCYLKDYVAQLETALTPQMSALEHYRTVYCCFNQQALRYPEIYHTIFFGKYSDRLGDVLELYYGELFPQELKHLHPETQNMLKKGKMEDRDRATIERMVQEGDLDAEKAQLTMELIIALHQNFLYRAMMAKDAEEARTYEQSFRRMFDYLLDAGR